MGSWGLAIYRERRKERTEERLEANPCKYGVSFFVFFFFFLVMFSGFFTLSLFFFFF